MPSVVEFLSYITRRNALGMQPICGTKSRHAGPKDNNIWLVLHQASPGQIDQFHKRLVTLDLRPGEAARIDSLLKTPVPLDDPGQSAVERNHRVPVK